MKWERQSENGKGNGNDCRQFLEPVPWNQQGISAEFDKVNYDEILGNKTQENAATVIPKTCVSGIKVGVGGKFKEKCCRVAKRELKDILVVLWQWNETYGL